jgi:hypothetical protein
MQLQQLSGINGDALLHPPDKKIFPDRYKASLSRFDAMTTLSHLLTRNTKTVVIAERVSPAEALPGCEAHQQFDIIDADTAELMGFVVKKSTTTLIGKLLENRVKTIHAFEATIYDEDGRPAMTVLRRPYFFKSPSVFLSLPDPQTHIRLGEVHSTSQNQTGLKMMIERFTTGRIQFDFFESKISDADQFALIDEPAFSTNLTLRDENMLCMANISFVTEGITNPTVLDAIEKNNKTKGGQQNDIVVRFDPDEVAAIASLRELVIGGGAATTTISQVNQSFPIKLSWMQRAITLGFSLAIYNDYLSVARRFTLRKALFHKK